MYASPLSLSLSLFRRGGGGCAVGNSGCFTRFIHLESQAHLMLPNDSNMAGTSDSCLYIYKIQNMNSESPT